MRKRTALAASMLTTRVCHDAPLARGAVLALLVCSAWITPAGFAAAQGFASASMSSAPNMGVMLPEAPMAPSAAPLAVAPDTQVRLANFGQEAASPEARKLADWVVDSSNNGRLPFMVIDKVQARVFVFDAQGQLRGAAPALLGMAVGDHSVPGIGERKLSSIRPEERTTAAGRFVASLDRDLNGKELLWVDYDSALSLHPVVPGQPNERRAQRLASPSPLDNRISFGCINVPVKFYETVVNPAFTGTEGIVYIMPETQSARDVFGSYDVQDPLRKQVSAQLAPTGQASTR